MNHFRLLPVFLLAAPCGGGAHADEARVADRFDAGVQIALRLVDDYGTPAHVEEPEPAGTESADIPAADATAATGATPDLAGQMSAEEQRAKLLEDAQAVLDRTDEILLEAQAEARRVGDAEADGGEADMTLEDWDGHGADDGTGRTAGGTADDAGDVSGTPEPDTAEGRLPGNVATGRSGRVGSYEEDGDIVARQVCDMARREPDPEVKKKLEEKCESLKSN